jgi:CRP-like cAMP-binding protein
MRDMRDSPTTALAVTVSRPDRVFPTLSHEQMSRVAAHGRRRSTTRDEVLVEVGDKPVPAFVVVSGTLAAVWPTDRAETLIVTHHAGQFSGEASMISGRRALGRLRVREPGEVIQLDREQLLGLIQTDAELSEILMRAFILRRLELIAHDLGDAIVIGSPTVADGDMPCLITTPRQTRSRPEPLLGRRRRRMTPSAASRATRERRREITCLRSTGSDKPCKFFVLQPRRRCGAVAKRG